MTQWTYFSKEYSALLDIDEVDGRYQGVFVGQAGVGPVEIAAFGMPDLAKRQKLSLQLTPYSAGGSYPLTEEQRAVAYPNGYQGQVEAELLFGTDTLNVWIETKWRGKEHFQLPNPKPNDESKLAVHSKSWSEFSSYCSSLPERRFVFRGQDSTAKLRTSFHRTGKTDLYRYATQTLPNAYRALSGKTNQVFSPRDPDLHAAFLNLLQHHGFPTPLLDWSESPFIAAYFAFSKPRPDHVDHDLPVRVFCFDRQAWEGDWSPVAYLTHVGPHVSTLYPLSIENPRAGPQQALSMVTNLDDIEDYIGARSEQRGATYLYAIDLPYAERHEALKDLAMMGITQGTLFPGLDGICSDLRDRFFGRR